MGVILDSSVAIAAERRGDTVDRLVEHVLNRTGDQEAALAAVGLTELIHGIYRAKTPEIRLRRESFINDVLAVLAVFSFTREAAAIADSTVNSKAREWSYLLSTSLSARRPCRWVTQS